MLKKAGLQVLSSDKFLSEVNNPKSVFVGILALPKTICSSFQFDKYFFLLFEANPYGINIAWATIFREKASNKKGLEFGVQKIQQTGSPF